MRGCPRVLLGLAWLVGIGGCSDEFESCGAAPDHGLVDYTEVSLGKTSSSTPSKAPAPPLHDES